MRLIITLIIALAITLIPIQQSSARVMQVSTGTIYGQVHYNGKGIPFILVEVMTGNCFARAVKVLSTNAAGFYRVDGVRAGTPVHVAVNGFSKTARNKLYKATCGKAVTLRRGQLNRHNIALQLSGTTKKPTQMPTQQSPTQTSSAPPSSIYGRVHSKGKGVRHILVEAKLGSCFSRSFKVLSTNSAGFYRIDGVKVGTPVHIAVNGFGKSARNKLYKATCGKGLKLRPGQLNRHNIILQGNQSSKQQQCAAAGGSWDYISRGFKGCNYTYSDGGKACRDGKYCKSGACLAKRFDRNSTIGACATTSANRNSSCTGIIRNSRWFPKACQ